MRSEISRREREQVRREADDDTHDKIQPYAGSLIDMFQESPLSKPKIKVMIIVWGEEKKQAIWSPYGKERQRTRARASRQKEKDKKQKQIYEDNPTADKDKDLESARKFQKSRQKLEESDAIMDAIDEESSDKSEERQGDESSSESGASSGLRGDGSALNDDDEVFVQDDDADDDLEEWW